MFYAGFGFKAKNFEMLSEQHSKWQDNMLYVAFLHAVSPIPPPPLHIPLKSFEIRSSGTKVHQKENDTNRSSVPIYEYI